MLGGTVPRSQGITFPDTGKIPGKPMRRMHLERPRLWTPRPSDGGVIVFMLLWLEHSRINAGHTDVRG
ncbi:MAG: hypothetical protein ACRCU1_16575, partial [Alsobacter sp.]